MANKAWEIFQALFVINNIAFILHIHDISPLTTKTGML